MPDPHQPSPSPMPATTPTTLPAGAIPLGTHAHRGRNGFFCVQRSERGVWTLRDPADKPFVYRGVCGVNRAGTQGGRRAKPGPYADAVDRRYDYPRSPGPFVQATVQRLRDWGFNAFGAWTTEEFFDAGLPYTEILEFAHVHEPIRAPGLRLPDVFDPQWRDLADRQARKLCLPRRNDPHLIGYFTDNELSFAQPGTDHIWGAADLINTKGATLLQAACALQNDLPARAEARRWLLERHGTFDRIARAWEADLRSFDQLTEQTAAGLTLSTPGYGTDHDLFTRHYVGTYLREAHAAIRRYDTNHLILGTRYGAPPGGPVLQLAQWPWADVQSANNYRVDFFGRMDLYHRTAGEPILNGEFSWASPPFQDGARDQAARLAHVRELGREALERAFTHPALIGYTWYRWVQKTDAAGIGYGLVDEADQPVSFNTDLLRNIHTRLDAIHARR